MRTDLHIHTYFSDGVFSPEKIVDTAIDVGLQAIAITDHDNVLAYDVAQKYIKDNHLENKIEIINFALEEIESRVCDRIVINDEYESYAKKRIEKLK